MPSPLAWISGRLGSPWVFAGLLLAAFLVRLIGLDGRWLWFDELLSATFSAHDLGNTLLTNLRFDVHPPLYYLQLTLWSALGRSDAWLMLNSVFWSVAAVALLVWRVRKVYNLQVALLGGLLLAFAPAALVFGDQVRMYAFLMVLILWVWLAQAEFIAAVANGVSKASTAQVLSLILSQLAVIYTHSAGFVMISGCVLLSAASLVQLKAWRASVHWVAAQACVALLALPALAIIVVREAQHPVAPSLEAITQTWRFLSAGALGPQAIGALMGLALLAALLYWLVRNKPWRLEITLLIFAPLVLAALVSHLVKPMWLDRVFVTTIPFICLYFSLGLLKLVQDRTGAQGAGWRSLFAGAFVLLWMGIGIAGQAVREKGDGYRPAAVFAQENARSGDAILVDGDYAYWCFLWYFGGADWGRPQQAYIMTPKWQALVAKLDPGLRELLGFGAQTREVAIDGVDVVMWDRKAPEILSHSGDVFVVRAAHSTPLSVEGRRLVSSRALEDMVIEKWHRPLDAEDESRRGL